MSPSCSSELQPPTADHVDFLAGDPFRRGGSGPEGGDDIGGDGGEMEKGIEGRERRRRKKIEKTEKRGQVGWEKKVTWLLLFSEKSKKSG